MRKKGFAADSSVSILLTVPEGISHAEAATRFLETQSPHPQPFFFNTEEGTVTIDMVRELIRHSSFARAASEPQAVIVCAAHTATIPAQNALLKIIEEPPPHTQFILTVYSGHALLPTIVSRCREILWTDTAPVVDEERPAGQDTLLQFLKNPSHASYHELITLAEQFKETATAKKTLKLMITLHAATLAPAVTQQLMLAFTALEKNGNVRLTLEHCFFAIKAAASTQNR